MHSWLRETVVTIAIGVILAGPVSALMLVALPAAWRRPSMVWAVVLVSVAVVSVLRNRQRSPP